MRASIVCFTALVLATPAVAAAQPCSDADGDGYGVYPGTSTRAGCAHDGIDCDDSDPAVHPFAKEVCGNGKDDDCRHGVDEGCGAPEPFDGWRLMTVRSEGEFSRGEPGGRAEQWLQGAARCASNPDVLYLSHDCSVVWRSRDGGATWEKPLSHGLLLPHGQSIEVDPVDCNRVVLVVDQAWNYKNAAFTGIYLSEDGGEHWALVQRGPAFHSRRYEHDVAFAPSSVDAQGARTWYAALYNEATEAGHDQAGLYRSDDRGRTWTRRASLTDHFPVYEVQVSPSDAQVLLVASSSGLFRSGDGGGSLQEVGDLPAGQVTSVAFSPEDARVVYAVLRESTANGLYRSQDGGATFVRLGAAVSLQQTILQDAQRVFIHPRDGDVFFVVPQGKTNGKTALRTDDGGATYATTSVTVAADVAAGGWGRSLAGAFSFVLMSASDSRQVVAQGSGASLYRSTDGKAFGNGSTLYEGANCGGQNHAIAFDRARPERFLVAFQDIGAHLTENGGDWFVPRNVPQAWVGAGQVAWSSQWTADLHPTLGDRFLSAVGTSFKRKVVRSVDAGRTWSIVAEGEGAYLRVLHHPFAPQVVHAGKRRSLDGGQTFTPLSLPPALDDADLQVMDHCRAQPDVLYAASRSSRRILRSDDQGATWSLYGQSPGSMGPFDSYLTFAVDPVRCDVVYALDSTGDLARFDGKSWESLDVLEQVTAPAGYFVFVRSVLVDPHHPEVLYASVFGSGLPALFRSVDGGATWQDVSLNRFREGVSGINVSPHSGEVMVGGCSGTWVLPPPYPANHGLYRKLVSRPSCLDGLRNGEEEGVDCGGWCPTACAPKADAGWDAGPVSVDASASADAVGEDAGSTTAGDAAASGDATPGPQGDGGPSVPADASGALVSNGCGCGVGGRDGAVGLLALALLGALAPLAGRRPDQCRSRKRSP